MSKTLISYYLFLAVVVGFQLLSTLYTGSLVVFRTQELHELKASQQELAQANLSLQTQLSAKQSLTSLAASPVLEQYASVIRPISISGHSSVALNNL